uniref:G-protein coupled receptors family 1 profile domain-containing protein n=1 Tax=Clytia hemisphaerica TaxID=252671 RepID=A0A7M5V582_9CNID
MASLGSCIGGLFILAANTMLYRSVKRQCQSIITTLVEPTEIEQQKRRNNIRKRQLRSLKICIYIAGSYLLTWFPLMVTVVLQIILEFNKDIVFIMIILGFSNGIWDVVIYFHLNRTSRKRLFKLLRLRTTKADLESSNGTANVSKRQTTTTF